MQVTTLLAAFFVTLLQLLGPLNNRPVRQPEPASLPDYVGTWVGHTPTGEFKLVLQELKSHPMPDGNKYDFIVGRHSYTTTESSVRSESLSMPSGDYALSALPYYEDRQKLFATFSDNVNHKSFQVLLSFVNGDKTKLSWEILRQNETWVFDAALRPLPGASVPTSVVLTKVE